MAGHPPDDTATLTELGRGFRRRTLVTFKTMARAGMRTLKRSRGARQALESVDEAQAVAWAEALVQELDQLKGLSLKVGQMMSYLDASIPPKAQRILSRLQFASRPLAPERIVEVVTDALGAPPDRVFDSFEPLPFAAASIGQVHRARLAGRDLAVKVQYPDIRALLAGDLRTVGRLGRLVTLIGPLDGRALIDELQGRVLEECDYLREAESQERFRHIFADDADLDVPRVYPELSAATVLTTQFVDRQGFQAFVDSADQAAKDRAGALIYEAAFRAIFGHGAYNADPHPGNFLFSRDGQVTLLDFGCVKTFSPEMIASWKRLARAILDDDLPAFRRAWDDAGFVWRKRRFDYQYQLRAMQVLYEPMRAPGPFTFTADFLERTHDALVFRNRNKLKLTMPPEWLFVNRLQFGMFSVLVHLGATARWGEIFRAALERPVIPLAEVRPPDPQDGGREGGAGPMVAPRPP